jgi:BMFP domain-containing protein YqiC
MPVDNKLLDDLARVAGGAASLISTVRRQVQSDLRGRVDAYADRMDLAPKAEIERLQALVSTFRTEQTALKERVAELEALVKGKAPAKKVTASPKAKTAPKAKPSAKKAKRKA